MALMVQIMDVSSHVCNMLLFRSGLLLLVLRVFLGLGGGDLTQVKVVLVIVFREGSVDGMLVEVNRLNIMLIVKFVIEFMVRLVSAMMTLHVTSYQVSWFRAVMMVHGPLALSMVLISLFHLLLVSDFFSLRLQLADLSLLLLARRGGFLGVRGTLRESLVVCHHLLLVVAETVLGVGVVVNEIGMVVVMVLWLHLDDKVAIAGVDILRVEDTAVRLKSAAKLVPATLVELVEIIAPVEVEVFSVRVVLVGLHVVKEKVPGHVFACEVSTPSVEGGRPEVHSQ